MASFHRAKRTLENDDVSALPSSNLSFHVPVDGLPRPGVGSLLELPAHCVGYLVALLGDATILHRVRTDPVLHQPVYYSLAVLAGTDLGLWLSMLPSGLGALWLETQMVGLGPCVLQQRFLHSFMEPAVLFTMVLDSLVAIRFSLRYASMLMGPLRHWSGSCWARGALPSQPRLHCIS